MTSHQQVVAENDELVKQPISSEFSYEPRKHVSYWTDIDTLPNVEGWYPVIVCLDSDTFASSDHWNGTSWSFYGSTAFTAIPIVSFGVMCETEWGAQKQAELYYPARRFPEIVNGDKA